MTRRIHPRHLGVVAATLVLLVAAAACGISNDSKPRDLPPGAIALLDSGSTATSAPTGSEASPVKLYFLADEHLTATTSTLTGEPSAEGVLQVLFQGPSAQQLKEGITSAIPSNVKLISAEPDEDDILQVNLGPEIGLVGGNGAKAAYAQMVFTVAGLGHDQVQFSIDGKQIQAPTDDGNKSVVTVDDYKPPLKPG
jgi:hypothetical protein